MPMYKYTRKAHYRKLPSGRSILVRGYVKGHKYDKVKTGHKLDMMRRNRRQKHEMR